MLSKLLLSIVFVVLTGCNKKQKPNFILVQEGDTLDLIAEKYNVSINHLIKFNKLKVPYILSQGQILQYTKLETKIKLLRDEEHKLSKNKKEETTPEFSNNNEEKKEDSNVELDDALKEELASESSLDKENVKINKTIAETKVEKTTPIAIKQNVLGLIMPIKGGKIDDSLPFSQKHGKRQDGVYILNKGDVVSSCDGKVVFVDNENKAIYVKKDVNGISWIVTYSSLSSIVVEHGSEVKQGDKIGESSGSIFVRIWNGKEYTNPSKVIF